ncbi:M18 family aminopeptidase [Marinimicrobium sp. ABcell2]|uniref:M18 family aminopeptidase n=1 Tax=Marinimicrobium sp. ABcell2 TaxID=3069751 RepID=UPI0027B4FA52|nr:M18 family aminopeptidase [Marinimicrobium sp. ABcell2]MDQ2077172.1 M18 family aminopeptidase [Marinimicrobium sp. ABcell2]
MSKDVMDTQSFNTDLLSFLQASPTPFHATDTIVQQLSLAGFTELREGDAWNLQAGGRYWLTRNDSSVIAFVYGKRPMLETGIRMVGAHTDSPCLKVKPQPELTRQNYAQLGVEVYGGVLMAPWFDRDLSMAGRVSFRGDDDRIASALVDFVAPVAVVPSLAIHLDREANRQRCINPQKELPPLLLQLSGGDKAPDFRALLHDQLRSQHPELTVAEVLDYEISLYDTQAPALVGLKQDFIASARLDNLLSCYVGLRSLLEADPEVTSLLVCNDHEEVGSASSCGAKGPMLQQFLERLLPDPDSRVRVLDRSLMISADNAHGVHPNFSDRHDENHGPLLNAGPVIKVNANQRYATNSATSALFRELCRQVSVPVQTFVSRTDMECGSTIGPVTAAEIGVKTLDVGVPTFAMHSIRELAGSQDACYLYQVLKQFYGYPHPLV